MQPLVEENVIINGNRIAYGIHGAGHPVVLLHGTPSSSLIWRNIVPHLTSSGFKVHVYDLLGYVPILEGLLAHWELETFHLIAHDIGGGIAQRFGIFFPHRLRSLSLIDVVSFDSYPSKRTKDQMKNGLEALIKVKDDEHRSHFKNWLLSAVHGKQKFSDSSLDTFLEYISGPIGQGSLFQHQVRHYDPKHTMEIADRVPELGKLPVKLIWGADDAWQVVDWGIKLNKTIPGSELEVIEHCGHFSPEDQPDKIAEILAAFLNRHQT